MGSNHTKLPKNMEALVAKLNDPQIQTLDRLDWQRKNLQTIPFEITKLSRLTSLHLSNNHLTHLPDHLFTLTALTTLRVRANALITISPAITNLGNLTCLELAQNELTEVGDFMGDLVSLTDLSFSWNGLRTVSPTLSNLKSLRFLNLSLNKLKTLPDLRTLTNLECLELSHNRFLEIPKTCIHLTSMHTLNLIGNQIQILDDQVIGGLIGLRILDLQNNDIVSLPDTLAALGPNLTCLKLRSNQIETIPNCITALDQLEELELGENKIRHLPKNGLGNLTRLQILALYNNKIQELPEDLCGMTSLSELGLSYNSLLSLPVSLGKLPNLVTLRSENNVIGELPAEMVLGLTKLQFLHFNNNALKTLPDTINNMSLLQHLDCCTNNLTTFPTVTGLPNLGWLGLGDNQIYKFPLSVCSLNGLQILNLFGNFLNEIPPEIGKLVKLHTLSLGYNLLRDLPEEFGDLVGLRDCYLSGNKFDAIPEPVFRLTSLEQLSFSNNLISEISPKISGLQKLKVCFFSSNRLVKVPAMIGNLGNLAELDLSHNELQELPLEIGNLSALTDLDISGNALLGFPETFSQCRNVKQLKMGYNRLRTFPRFEAPEPKPGQKKKSSHVTWISCAGNEWLSDYYAEKFDHAKFLSRLEKKSRRYQKSIEREERKKKGKGAPEFPSSDSDSDNNNNNNNDLPRANSGSGGMSLANFVAGSGSGGVVISGDVRGSVDDNNVRSEGIIGINGIIGSPPDPQVVDGDPPGSLSGDENPRDLVPRKEIVRRKNFRDVIISDVLEPKPEGIPPLKSTSSTPQIPSIVQPKKKDVESRQMSSSIKEHMRYRLKLGWAEMRGRRPNMEDTVTVFNNFRGNHYRTLLCCFDGHTGEKSAEWAARRFYSVFCAKLDEIESRKMEEYKKKPRSVFERTDTKQDKQEKSEKSEKSEKLDKQQQISQQERYTKARRRRSQSLGDRSDFEEVMMSSISKKSSSDKIQKLIGKSSGEKDEKIGTPKKGKKEEPLKNSIPTVKDGKGEKKRKKNKIPIKKGRPIKFSPGGRRYSSSSPLAYDMTKLEYSEYDVLFSASFAEIHDEIRRKQFKDGTTALVVLIEHDHQRMLVANLGDQRAVLARGSDAIQITTDHKPDDPGERHRIYEVGGYVNEQKRVNGMLAVSRSLGDAELQPAVTFIPDVHLEHLLPEDRFVIVACDGLWDVLSNEKAVEIVNHFRCPVRAAIALRDYAYCLGSMDNISVIIYRLDDTLKFKDLNLYRGYTRTGSGGLPNNTVGAQSRSSSGDHKSRSGGSSGGDPRSEAGRGEEGLGDPLEYGTNEGGGLGEGDEGKEIAKNKNIDTEEKESPVIVKKAIKSPSKKSRTLQVQVPQTRSPKSSTSYHSRSPSPSYPPLPLSSPLISTLDGDGDVGGYRGPQKTLSLDSARKAKSGNIEKGDFGEGKDNITDFQRERSEDSSSSEEIYLERDRDQ